MKIITYFSFIFIAFCVVVVTGLLIQANKRLVECNEHFYLLSERWCIEQCSEWKKEYGKISGICGVEAQGVGMKLCEEWLK